MEALHDKGRAGKARSTGASCMHAWYFAKALYLADLRGWTCFVSLQSHYNLMNREEEQEKLALCGDQGIAVLHWSTLARGRLARVWKSEVMERKSVDIYDADLYARSKASDKLVVQSMLAVAAERSLPPARIALAWLPGRLAVTAPIVGATMLPQLDDAVGALDVKPSAEEVACL